VRGANIRVITSKVRGIRINLSAHEYTDAEGNVVPAMYKVCATIRAKDIATARRVVAELTTLKDKCENPAQLTWTPTNLAPGAFIGKGAIIIRSFNKRHNVRCWFDNEARHFIIESIERRNVLAAVADLERRDALPPSPKPASVGARSTNSFAALAEEALHSHAVRDAFQDTINLDVIDAMVGVSDEIKAAMKATLNRSSFPTVGTAAAAGAGAGRGRWSARREDTMAALTAVPVPPPAPKKPARPVGLTIKCPSVPVMQSLDSPISPPPPIAPTAAQPARQEWWDESEEEEDCFGAQLRRQTSFNAPYFGTDVSGRMCQMAYEAAEDAKAAKQMGGDVV